MIDIPQALVLIRQHCHQLDAVTIELPLAAGHVLAESVISDVNSPPFDKSMMDGFAVRLADLVKSPAELEITDRIRAGGQSDRTLHAGQAIQIMTGAPIPRGTDAVVMIEHTSETTVGGRAFVSIELDRCTPGQNILRCGETMSRGDEVKCKGERIRAEDVGLLAEAGAGECRVIPKPAMSVIATGDELIDVNDVPGGSQIRNSNGPMLAAMGQPLCRDVHDLGIGTDDRRHIKEKIEQGLASDVLVLSGGVSAGVADLVPGLLVESGVVEIFHKVNIKPGKPIWFGAAQRPGGSRTLVFGLPGNPVSSMVCFHVFVAPALRGLAGRPFETPYESAKLEQAHKQRPGRTTYWPSVLDGDAADRTIRTLDWKGSADLKTLAAANCFAVLPGDKTEFSRGERVRALCFDHS